MNVFSIGIESNVLLSYNVFDSFSSLQKDIKNILKTLMALCPYVRIYFLGQNFSEHKDMYKIFLSYF